MDLMTPIQITDEIAAAKTYAENELGEGKKIRPILTLYRGKNGFMDVYYPLTEGHEERKKTMTHSAWIGSQFSPTTTRFILDSSIAKTSHDGQSVVKDALLVIFATEQGCSGYALPYSSHSEINGLVWEDPDKSEDILDSHPDLVGFTASQFFFKGGSVTWSSYLKYLESLGFEISFRAPYTSRNIGYGLKTNV